VDEIRLARRTLLRSYHWCEWALAQPGADEAQVKGRWREAVAAFQDALEKINAQILTFNLELPPVLAHRQRPRLKLEDELRWLGLRTNWPGPSQARAWRHRASRPRLWITC